MSETELRTTGHAWADGGCANCGAEPPRPWAEPCPSATTAGLSLLLRQAARAQLGLKDGDYWPADVADAQARAVIIAEADALRIVRLCEQDMAEQALSAWHTADARRDLADHEALVVHADALTRWSERLRMALRGEDYRERVAGQETSA